MLDAKFRYLELAGIAECEEDAALLQERARFRQLLPDEPNLIDERELEYVVLVTGLALEVVQQVDQGEAAYLDDLGLLEWQDEEARDSRVGSPAPWEDAPRPEGQGTHWDCITSDDSGFIRRHLQRRPGPEQLLFAVGAPNRHWAGIAARTIPQAPGLETWRLDGAIGSGEALITAYPVARDGALQPLTLHQVQVQEGDCEAIVMASTRFGAALAYFDPAFLHPWNEWGPGEEVPVRLAAFAHSLAPVADLAPSEGLARGKACFFPLPSGNPDKFGFQGPVTGVEVHQAWEQTFYRLDVTVMRDTAGAEDVPFSLPVYVAEAKLPGGYRPRAGDQVRGTLWLQGCSEALRYPVIRE